MDTMKLYRDAAEAILDERRDIDEAVKSIARATKVSTAQVRERMVTMVAAVKKDRDEDREAKAAARQAAKEQKAAEAAQAKAEKAAAREAKRAEKAAAKGEKTPRVLKEHVEPERFAEVRDRLGLSNMECARAINRSPSRITELTSRIKEGGKDRAQGGSIDIFNAWVQDLETFAKEKAERLAAAAAEAAKTAEPEAATA